MIIAPGPDGLQAVAHGADAVLDRIHPAFHMRAKRAHVPICY